MSSKYKLICTACGADCGDFADWFAHDQKCSCGCQRAEAVYNADYSKLFDGKDHQDSLFRYFDFLPLEDPANVVSCGEGAEPIEEWGFLEQYAKEIHGVDCKVYVVRNDLNGGSGTFKDIAAALGLKILNLTCRRLSSRKRRTIPARKSMEKSPSIPSFPNSA